NQSILASQSPNLVGFSCPLADQCFANTMGRLHILLCPALDGNVTHRRSAHGFTDSFGVGAVVFVAFDVRFDELGGQQLDTIATSFEFTTPVMGRATGFHSNLRTGWNPFA